MMTALFIAMLTGIAVWWFLVQRLKTKPWMQQGVIAGSQDGLTSSAPKVGLWAFLGVVSSLFLVFTGAYIMRKDHGHGGGMHVWTPVDEPSVLWLNTLVLVLASVAMQLAKGAADRDDLGALRKSFTSAGVLTVVFLLGQLWVWQMLAATGLYTAETPAYSFFILLTAVHGAHLIGGLFVLTRAARRIWGVGDGVAGAAGAAASVALRPSRAVAAVRTSVELCAIYWHFLLVVWIGLFWLLLSS